MRTVEAKVATPRKVAFLSRHGWPWMRQTANGSGHHEGLEISLVAAEDDDWLVVFDDIAQPVPTRVPRSRRILFVTEPPGQKRYRPRAVNQFGTLVSPYRIDGFQGHWIASQPAINWFYGVSFEKGGLVSRLGLEHLRAMQVPEPKASRISVVCSTKRRLPGHRARLELLDHLVRAFPGQIDLFGRGFKEIGDKAEVIGPYRYHLVLENSVCPHFWTEKLADAYLGYCLPIFSGCANVVDYFPPDSLVRLPDLADHSGAVAIIGNLLQNDPWAERLESIRTARNRLIERYNIFSVIARITETAGADQRALPTPEEIYPGKDCTPIRTIARSGLRAAERWSGWRAPARTRY
jgi:hypothetical protein